MGTYVGKVKIGSTTVPIASSLFGICSTAAADTQKQVTCGDFDKLLNGVTVFVRFDNGNTNTNINLIMGGTTAYPVTGNCLCAANSILAFTLDITATDANDAITTAYWRCLGNAAFPATQNPSAVGDTASKGTSGSYAREDHVHNIVVGQGDANGQVKIAGQNASVKGLGSAAYTDSTAYATSAQGTLADNAMPKSGGTFTGSVILNGAPTANLEAATKAYVDSEISSALTGTADAMVFKGTLGTNGIITDVPTNSYSIGDTYRIITAGTYAGERCEVGDLIIAVNNGPATGNSVIVADWTIAQGNLDGTVIGPSSQVTGNNVVLFDGTTGKLIKDSGKTLGTSVPSGAVFTDTTYTLTDGSAYTNHSLTADTGASILANINDGVLELAPGIKFTTGSVGASITASTSGA